MTNRMRHASELEYRIGTELHPRGVDAAIAELAGRQYGVVSHAQLIAIGLTPRMIRRRIEAGRLHPIHRGVYAVGHTRLAREGRWLAAVLACGDGAVLSHRSAAALWGIRQYEGRPEVIAPHAHRRGPSLAASRSAIEPDERTEHKGIPTTTPARTLLDLGTRLRPHQLDRAVREADYLRLFDLEEAQRLLDRYPRRRGTKRLRRAIADAAKASAHTRSELEDRFRTLVLDADLPAPDFNATIELGEITIEADAVWPEQRVVVELDGWAAHGTRQQFVDDRRRDRAAQLAGYAVLRFTWDDLDAEPVRRLLSARTPPRFGRPRSAAPRG